MRTTKQKTLLEKSLAGLNTFFTAEDLAKKVKSQNIGMATVYRFLSSLSKSGHLHSYQCNRKTIYSLNNLSHSHFTCTQCSKKRHIEIRKLDFLKLKEKVCHFQIDITGICEICSSK